MDDNKIPVVYMSASGTSFRWGQAFAKGCGGKAIQTNLLRDHPFASFPDPSFWFLFEEARRKGLTFYYGDHAYFGRRKFYRATKNAMQHSCVGASDGQRFDALQLKIKPWRTGSKILLCPQSETFHKLHGHTQQGWIKDCVAKLKQHTDRPIEIRTKIQGAETESLFRAALVDVHAVVVFTSVAGVQAALEGVPCFATHDCAAAKFGSMDLSLIESPVLPDNRWEMACVLADNQWTLQQIERGEAWAKLQ
jgi:hypothetical protein